MRKNLTIVFLSLIILIPTVSHAARDYGGRNRVDAFFGQVYLVLKYGEITVADSVPEDGSDIRNFGFAFGKGINDVLSMEFEYTTTVSKDSDYLGSGSSVEIDTLGVFVVGKTPGNLYAKGRLGYVRSDQEFGDASTSILSDLDGSKNVYGIAYGLSGGYKFTKGGAIELEYMVYPTRDDVEIDFRPVGGPLLEEDLEMDFISINYILSFE